MERFLTAEQIFKPGNTVQIIYSEYIGEIQFISATIKDFQQDGIYISASKEEALNRLEAGTEIMIQYEHPDGTKYLVDTYSIARVSRDTSIIICAKPWKTNSSLSQYRYFGPKMEMPWKVHFTSLRRYFRMKVDLPIYYVLDEVIHIGKIVDLSIGGMFVIVHPNPRFILGIKIDFQLQLPKETPFELEGEIIRSQSIEGNKFGLAVTFLNLPPDNRERIILFLSKTMHES